MTIRRVAMLAAFVARSAFAASPSIAPTVLPSSAGCTPPSDAVACSLVGAAYDAVLTPLNIPGGSGAPVWSFASGTPPPGLGIDSASGVIAGSPTQPGLYTFTVAATYATMPVLVVTQQYSIAVGGPKLSIVAPLSLPNEIAGAPIAAAVFTATGGVPFIDAGGSPFYHWSIVPGQGSQADGLVMDQNSGTLSGTPANAGVFSITIGVIDAVGVAAIHIYTLNVSGSNSLTITTTSLPGGIVNAAYSQKLTETGGPVPGVAWAIVSGSGNLPPGLSISSNTDSTGTIAGTPTTAGTYNFTVQASYQVSNLGSPQIVTGTAALSITITTQLTMANPTAVSGFVNQQVSMQFTAVNGAAPFTYALKSGNLPPGTTLIPQVATAGSAVVSGQATTAGTFTFTIQVTDAVKQTATAQGTITITVLTGSPALTPTGTVAAGGQQAVTLMLGIAPGVALSGTLTLTFASTASSNVGADNPEVRFTDGTRKVSFSAAADGTVALPVGLKVMTGTVAGTGTIVIALLDPLNPTGPPLATATRTFIVAPSAPVIASFAIACNPAVGTTPAFYTATIVGYSTTLDMTGLTLNFTPTNGVTLANPSLTVSLPSMGTCSTTGCTSLPAWWTSSGAAMTGSQFTLTVQLNFTVTGGASTNPIDAATATLANSVTPPTASAAASPNPACP